MNHKKFIELLKKQMPSEKELKDYGLSNEEVENIQKVFIANEKLGKKSSEGVNLNDELVSLINNYDCSNISISIFNMAKNLLVFSNGYIVGMCEANPVVIHLDGGVFMYDHEDMSLPPTKCANNGEKFLDALILLASNIRTISKIKNKGGNRDFIDKISEQCISVAGGNECKKFYKGLF